MIKTLEWTETGVVMIDQRRLPTEELYPVFRTYEEVAWAIKEMVVRGAPAIGVAAAMGIALGARDTKTDDAQEFNLAFHHICETLGATRPTAVNLFWAIERMRKLYAELKSAGTSLAAMRTRLIEEANRMHDEDIAANQAMGRHGAALIPDEATVLTHCNAGALATAGYGTALGVIRAAVEAGKRVAVFADETRPFLQGARLTAWELHKDNIPVTLITDNMAGHFMKAGRIDCIVVGADRIAANGDVANKIGTYSVAVLAKENAIPFYVAAPISTLDLSIPSGEHIPIEERTPLEVTHVKDVQLAPAGIQIANPAFDVTPNRYVAAIITERGVARAPYTESLQRLATGGE
jgi:methylthioribose-1-phosphate isomerase